MKELIKGIEIIGKSKDSGYRNDLYLIRTSEGRFIQLTSLLFHIVVALQQETDLSIIAGQVSQLEEKEVNTQAIQFLIDEKLVPLGIISDSSGDLPLKNPKTQDQFLGLKYRLSFVSSGMVNRIAGILTPFFLPSVMVTVLISFIILNVWIFFFHGVSDAINQTLYQPFLFVLIFGSTILAALFHEFGHATGAKYSKATPGKIGMGLYIVWPAFFTDMTDSYRLNRIGKLRGDIGGIYFNMIFALILADLYAATRWEVFLLIITLQNVEILHQLLPFLRLDGYFIVSDMVGIPDLFARITPILKSLLPGKRNPAVQDLKPWVKWIVSLWVFITVPVLFFFFGELVLNAPQIFLTAWNSMLQQSKAIGLTVQKADYFAMVIGGVQMLFLLLPVFSVAFVLYRMGKRMVSKISLVFSFLSYSLNLRQKFLSRP